MFKFWSFNAFICGRSGIAATYVHQGQIEPMQLTSHQNTNRWGKRSWSQPLSAPRPQIPNNNTPLVSGLRLGLELVLSFWEKGRWQHPTKNIAHHFADARTAWLLSSWYPNSNTPADYEPVSVCSRRQVKLFILHVIGAEFDEYLGIL